MTSVSTVHLQPGDRVVTSLPDGDDFGLLLVSPTTRAHRNRTVRTVRSPSVKCQGGQVVWFADGTKTRPINGRTCWLLAEEEDEVLFTSP
jgi:hypothetical protein